MNDGANIIYIGSRALIRTAGDSSTTNEYNRTELTRRYAVTKPDKEPALLLLKRGFKAPEFDNLYILNPPRLDYSETHVYFNCTFSGILEKREGGNGADYERVERPQNVAAISSTVVYLQPVYRFFYTLRSNLEPRVFSRVLERPATVTTRDNTTGDKGSLDGGDFFWEPYDLQRNNFDLYDEVIESWRLTYLG
jgi:hypothetical protein